MATAANRRPARVEMPAWGVGVFESRHASDFRMEVARHDALEVFYVLGGAGAFEVDGTSHPCRTGDVVVVPVGAAHRILDDPGRPLSLLGVRIGPAVWAGAPDLPGLAPAGRQPRDAVLSARVRAQVRRLLVEQSGRQPGRAGMMAGLALQLLAGLARAPQPGPAEHRADLRGAVEAYVADLSHRFYEPARIDGEARRLGMSRRRFTALFREVTGETWAEYVRRLRVAHAKRLLRATERSVLAIAFESGFEDLSSFYRAFQRLEGMAPHRWRQTRGSG
jgi:AraC-like DNA-binding protein/mannose-6-phosphate isomerase-like protein (cupin superfamily)